MDEVRKIESQQNKTLLAHTRYLWLYNKATLKEKDSLRLQEIMNQNSALALAYQFKENMKVFFTQSTKAEAEIYLQTWCDHVCSSNLHPFRDVV